MIFRLCSCQNSPFHTQKLVTKCMPRNMNCYSFQLEKIIARLWPQYSNPLPMGWRIPGPDCRQRAAGPEGLQFVPTYRVPPVMRFHYICRMLEGQARERGLCGGNFVKDSLLWQGLIRRSDCKNEKVRSLLCSQLSTVPFEHQVISLGCLYHGESRSRRVEGKRAICKQQQ